MPWTTPSMQWPAVPGKRPSAESVCRLSAIARMSLRSVPEVLRVPASAKPTAWPHASRASRSIPYVTGVPSLNSLMAGLPKWARVAHARADDERASISSDGERLRVGHRHHGNLLQFRLLGRVVLVSQVVLVLRPSRAWRHVVPRRLQLSRK